MPFFFNYFQEVIKYLLKVISLYQIISKENLVTVAKYNHENIVPLSLYVTGFMWETRVN